MSLFSPFLSLPASAAEDDDCLQFMFRVATNDGQTAELPTRALCATTDENGIITEKLKTTNIQDAASVSLYDFSFQSLPTLGKKNTRIEIQRQSKTIQEFPYEIGVTRWEDLRNTIAQYVNDNISVFSLADTNKGVVEQGKEVTTEYEGSRVVSEQEAASSVSSTVSSNCSSLSALSWIVCSLIDDLSGITQGMYDNFIKPSLQMEVGLLDNEGTNNAWSAFRDIANVLLVIVVLVVIVSQVTGFGIDNYGIKRLLPKIIVTAILLNISLFICRLGVDLSNIIGAGLQSFFDNIGNGISASGGNGWALVLTTLAGAAGIAGLAFGWLQFGMILFGLITAFIGTLTMFILLAVRKAGVILLAVLAPVAFILSVLPNTKSWFNKWLDAFKALLLLYPICSLVMGAGGLAAKIIMDSDAADNVFLVITAAIVAVAPIFLIPKLVSDAFKGLGNIGAKLNGFTGKQGARLGQAAQKKVDNSAFQSSINERRQQRVADRTHRALDRVARRQGQFGGKAYDDLMQDEKRQLQTSGRRARNLIARNAAANSELAKSSNALSEQAKLASGKYLAGMMAKSNTNQSIDSEDMEKWNKQTATIPDEFDDEYVIYGGKKYRRDKQGQYYDSSLRLLNSASQTAIRNAIKNKTATEHKDTYKYDRSTRTYRNGSNVFNQSQIDNFVKKNIGAQRRAKFVQGKDGRWVSMDGKNRILSDIEMQNQIKAGNGSISTYAEEKKIEARGSRAQDIGNAAAYAGMNDWEQSQYEVSRLTSANASGEIQIDHSTSRASSDQFASQRQQAANETEITRQQILFGTPEVSVSRAFDLAQARNAAAQKREFDETYSMMDKLRLGGPTGAIVTVVRKGGSVSPSELTSVISQIHAKGGREEEAQALNAITVSDINTMSQVAQTTYFQELTNSANPNVARYAKAQLKNIEAHRPVNDFNSYNTTGLSNDMASKYGEKGLAQFRADDLKYINAHLGSYNLSDTLFNDRNFYNAFISMPVGEDTTQLGKLMGSVYSTNPTAAIGFLSQFTPNSLISLNGKNNELKQLISYTGQPISALKTSVPAINKLFTELTDPSNAKILASLDADIRTTLGV